MSEAVRDGGPVRRGGRITEPDGRVITWSMAEGSRGRRWRWSVVDRRGVLIAAHTVELDPDGRFASAESAAAGGIMTLHREADGSGSWSLHGNRVAERGIDHLTVPAPAPEVVVVGSGPIAAAIASRGLAKDARTADVVEVGDDLGVRIAEASIRRPGADIVEVRTGIVVRRVSLDDDGLPALDEPSSTSWPLERE
ncbi:MAG: hypothetical protein L0227_12605 [Chloroflexi bacterium]|nr:hypothetical protein [Chloroflexota bacterium]